MNVYPHSEVTKIVLELTSTEALSLRHALLNCRADTFGAGLGDVMRPIALTLMTDIPNHIYNAMYQETS